LTLSAPPGGKESMPSFCTIRLSQL
jgi:hypothetical protein